MFHARRVLRKAGGRDEDENDRALNGFHAAELTIARAIGARQIGRHLASVQSIEHRVTDDLCGTCGRAGHYDAPDRVTELRYDAYPRDAPDFNRTREYFGVWRVRGQSSRLPVGGASYTIVSQRVRRLFRELKVRHISFEPIFKGELPPDPSPAGR